MLRVVGRPLRLNAGAGRALKGWVPTVFRSHMRRLNQEVPNWRAETCRTQCCTLSCFDRELYFGLNNFFLGMCRFQTASETHSSYLVSEVQLFTPTLFVAIWNSYKQFAFRLLSGATPPSRTVRFSTLTVTPVSQDKFVLPIVVKTNLSCLIRY